MRGGLGGETVAAVKEEGVSMSDDATRTNVLHHLLLNLTIPL